MERMRLIDENANTFLNFLKPKDAEKSGDYY